MHHFYGQVTTIRHVVREEKTVPCFILHHLRVTPSFTVHQLMSVDRDQVQQLQLYIHVSNVSFNRLINVVQRVMVCWRIVLIFILTKFKCI